MWIWRRVERVSGKVKVTDMDVLQRVNETRSILDTIWHWKRSWLEHVPRHDGLLKVKLEGKMIGKPARGRKRLNIISRDAPITHWLIS